MRYLLLLFCLLSIQGFGQVISPAKLIPIDEVRTVKAGDVVDLVFDATVDKNWYLYSTDFNDDCGPFPMSLDFDKNGTFELVGPLKGIDHTAKHDKIFDCDVNIFIAKGKFIQSIRVLKPELIISGTYDGQSCSDISGQCVQVTGDFGFNNIKVVGSVKVDPKTASKIELVEPVKEEIKTDTAQTAVVVDKATFKPISGPILSSEIAKSQAIDNSLWSFFLLAFVAGLAALLTPCVFPMIPMTVSYFTGKPGSKIKAIVYGLSIVVIYTIIGASLSPLMGPETANHLSTEWIPNLIFFVVFIVFGLSFLGLFEITLPGTFITKVDAQAEKGGLTGVFFMAFTLVLVSFSCTGPLVGSILVSSAGGEVIKPVVGMMGFSLAFAIPFTLFAFFPGWIAKLPKSGGWLNSVKVVLGFIEIALAFKFLSIADQAFHWRILDREINIAIWIVIGILTGLYLLKSFRLPGDTGKDSDSNLVSIPRLTLAMAIFTFVVYLIPGMFGAPLAALAGYLPPLYTHDFNLNKRESAGNEICEEPRFGDLLHLPHGLNGYFDYKQAIACARQQNKPLFIDFTGHGCTNCREMEAVVWPDPQVLSLLQNEFIVTALYVDDKTELPESEWYTSTYDNKVKRTIGKQNADLQISKLNNNAQPFYVLVAPNEEVLVAPYGYNKNPEEFVRFLKSGLTKFKAGM